MSAEPVLRHIDLPLQPGARITIQHSPGDTEFSPFGPEPSAANLALGYTIDVNGERWRAVFKSSSIGPDGAFLELEIEGRYQEDQEPVADYKRQFALQQQARDLGRNIMTGGSGWRGSYYGAVIATYPEGSHRAANHDSWRCHHEHPDQASALECALCEIRRLASGGLYEPCSAGPGCTDEHCRRDWARLIRVRKPS